MKAIPLTALFFISVQVFSQNFLMPVDSVFSITGRGTVATGIIERGIINKGDPVEIVGLGAKNLRSTITGVEMSQKLADRGEAGDTVGLLLRGIERFEIKRGMVICKPGSVTVHARFKARIYILTKEEGGNHTLFINNYRPKFHFRTVDVAGKIKLPAGEEMIKPGQHISLEIELIDKIAMEIGLRFVVLEDGRTVGSGRVTEMLD